MRPKALKANRTLTPLEIAELLLLAPEAGELAVELGCGGVEVGTGTEEVKVTPCVGVNEV